MKRIAILLLALVALRADALEPRAAFFRGTNALSTFDGISGLLVGTNGFRVAGDFTAIKLGSAVSAAGDFNGDGRPDLIVGAPFASEGSQVSIGRAHVLLSAPLTPEQTVTFFTNLAIKGAAAGDQTGARVAGGGDFNGDGLHDVAVGAPFHDAGTRTNAGAVAVVYGRTNLPSSLTLSDLDGTNGVLITGAFTNGSAGAALAFAGDINGDGRDDLLIGAPTVSTAGTNNVGHAYLLFGTTSRVATISLAALNGTNGSAFHGEDGFDEAGAGVAGVGDFNGDARPDIAIGAPLVGASGNGRAYVVFGQPGFPATNLLSALNGTNGFRVDHNGFFSGFAEALAGADLNGDGRSDLIVGERDGAACHIVFGTAQQLAIRTTSTLDGTNGFRITGPSGSSFGSSVARAGRVNLDAFDDVIIGAPTETVNGQTEAGSAYVVFGAPSFAAATDVARVTDGTNGFALAGQQAGAEAGFAVAGGADIDGDAQDDLLVGERDRDIATLTEAGAAYAIGALGIADLVLLEPELVSIGAENGTNRVAWRGQPGVTYDVFTNADPRSAWGFAAFAPSGGATTVWEQASAPDMTIFYRVSPRRNP